MALAIITNQILRENFDYIDETNLDLAQQNKYTFLKCCYLDIIDDFCFEMA